MRVAKEEAGRNHFLYFCCIFVCVKSLANVYAELSFVVYVGVNYANAPD